MKYDDREYERDTTCKKIEEVMAEIKVLIDGILVGVFFF